MVEVAYQGEETLQCLLCGGLRHRPVFHEFGIDILQCRDCRHVFSSFRANPYHDEFWGEEVVDGDQFYWNRARARMHQDFFRRYLGRSGRLLDVGCGLGFFLKAMASHKNWESFGYEISPAAVRYAREKLGLSNVICGRPEDAVLTQNSFDIITMWDVMEHLLRPDPLLRRCHALLKEGGICFVYTPNVHIQLARARLLKMLRGMRPGVSYMQGRDHCHHYSRTSIRKLMERNGFSRVEFVHLRPVQSVSGSKSGFLRGAKNIFFGASRALSMVSGGTLHFDNLFVVARKELQTRKRPESQGLRTSGPRRYYDDDGIGVDAIL